MWGTSGGHLLWALRIDQTGGISGGPSRERERKAIEHRRTQRANADARRKRTKASNRTQANTDAGPP
eukprot:6585216-Heterocapsa_arctica.AAC.1